VVTLGRQISGEVGEKSLRNKRRGPHGGLNFIRAREGPPEHVVGHFFNITRVDRPCSAGDLQTNPRRVDRTVNVFARAG
jgi:hypothetical protein